MLLHGASKLTQASLRLKATIEDGSPPMSHQIAVFRRLLLKHKLNLRYARPLGVLSITVLRYRSKMRFTHTTNSFLCNESILKTSNLSEECIGRLTPLFSGSLGRAKRRQVCPVEGFPARNKLQLSVMAFLTVEQKSVA
jgi:hypothetical protein